MAGHTTKIVWYISAGTTVYSSGTHRSLIGSFNTSHTICTYKSKHRGREHNQYCVVHISRIQSTQFRNASVLDRILQYASHTICTHLSKHCGRAHNQNCVVHISRIHSTQFRNASVLDRILQYVSHTQSSPTCLSTVAGHTTRDVRYMPEAARADRNTATWTVLPRP